MNTLIPLTRLFDAAMNSNFEAQESCSTSGPGSNRCSFTPRADISEGEKEFRIAMDLPGVKADNLEIDLENQTLTVKATREEAQPEGFEARRKERPSGTSFERSFTLGNSVDGEKIGARLDSGILTITLPKSQQSLPRKIEVK